MPTTAPTLALTLLLCATPTHPTPSTHPAQHLPPPPTRLTFTPDAPPPGSTVTVTYHPTTALAGAPELVLRGHFRTRSSGDSGRPPRNNRVATLTPGDGGSFTASVELPDSVALGVFVVEDIAGERLDANDGRYFDLLIHRGDKSSLADALYIRGRYLMDRDPAGALETLERAVELHREALAEQYPGDSVTITLSDAPVTTSGDDSDWGNLPPEAGWVRTWKLWEREGNSVAALEEFEDLWPGLKGKRTGVGNSALLIAVRSRDRVAADRWAERILDEGWTDPWADKLLVAKWIGVLPERLERARELARGAMADFDAMDPATYPGRPLGQTASDYAGVLARARAEAMIDNHRLLADAGFVDQVIDALETAGAESGESEHFRKLGELRLMLGDTAAAARAFAVVASDPGTPPARARALAGRVGLDADGPDWQRFLEAATADVVPLVRAAAVRRPLPPVRVADGEGERLSLEQIVDGRTTVIVFWARWCSPCVAEIPEVARLARLLEPHGIQVVSISTDDPPGPEMDAWLTGRNVTYAVYYDLDAEAGDVFGVETIPVVFVLDGEGAVRFESTHIAVVPRQLEALGLLR